MFPSISYVVPFQNLPSLNSSMLFLIQFSTTKSKLIDYCTYSQQSTDYKKVTK
ncbi:uncharacterized protein METZ01_LOCUS337393 [marine metagenome]|uniref:Uncharacterized protein n=1 Tax=marine metagenome TaxID=408172 RepID=A0A382QG93_9ZZZZ